MKSGRLGSLLFQEHIGPSSVSFPILFSTWNAFFFPFHLLKYYFSLRSIPVPTMSMKLSLLIFPFLSMYDTYFEPCNLAHNDLP